MKAELPRIEVGNILIGIAVPFLSALLRNSNWSGWRKAIFSKLIIILSSLAVGLSNGSISKEDVFGVFWVWLVSTAVEPQFRTNALKALDEWSTGIFESIKLNLEKNKSDELSVISNIQNTPSLDMNALADLIAKRMMNQGTMSSFTSAAKLDVKKPDIGEEDASSPI